MTSYRQIFKSSTIIGGASAINIVIGIVKVKVLAVLLGPFGVGLMGLYQNIIGTASTLAGCGIGSSGVRQLSASAGEASTLAIVRRTLWLSNLILGLIGMVVLWALREPVACWVFGDIAHASEVGWLGLGVLLTLIAGSQTALLQGLRRIGDLARVNIFSALFGALVGIALICWLGEDGVLGFVLTAPLFSILVATYYAAKLPRLKAPYDWQGISQQWQAMLKLGISFMAASLLTLVTQLAARSIILRELGVESSGYFEAAWAISMTYIGFVLGAMATDYFPRLTAVINDHVQARKLVNEQTEMALLLTGPVFLAMITLAPWVIQLLYAKDFEPATEILRWQVLGDIIKVSCWPMGFIVQAQGRGGLFISTQFGWNAIYLGTIFLGTQLWGVIAAGVAFWFAYVVHYGVVALLAFRLIGYRPAKRNWPYMLLLLSVGGLVLFLVGRAPVWGHTIGLAATVTTGLYSLNRLDGLMDLRGWVKHRIGQQHR